MIIDKLEFKNINSYGNNLQELKFGTNGGLFLLCGGNGEGKCVSGETEIEIFVEDDEISRKLLIFLENRKPPL